MTNSNKKQLKINKLFRKAQLPEDCEDLEDEIKQLEQKLKDEQDKLFQAQRNMFKRKLSAKTSPRKEQFTRPEKIIVQNNITNTKSNMDLITMLSGMQVKSYVVNDHCVIVYHLQHLAPHNTEHGLRIDMQSESNVVSKLSMPLGFNFNSVVEDFENIMTPECLGAIRNALVAYYERQEQFNKLKSLLTVDAQLFKVMDGTHMEISFKADSDEEEQFEVLLTLQYRVYDITPKNYIIKETYLPDGVADGLTEQCLVFKKKPLHVAFKECFMSGKGPYNFIRVVERNEIAGALPAVVRRRRKPRSPRYDPNNDDTFRPEDCPLSSEEEDERDMREIYQQRR